MHGLAPEFVYTYQFYARYCKGEWEEEDTKIWKKQSRLTNGRNSAPTATTPICKCGLCLSKIKKKVKHTYCKKAQKLEPKDPEAYLIDSRM